MILIETYIAQPKESRQAHLKLNEPCTERGGNSENYRGLLAHLLNTSIPKGQKIHLCHARHNSKCGNPNHLYWGTSKENSADRMANGGKTAWQHTVDKYGEEIAKKLQSECKIGNTSGSGNLGKPKSDNHKSKIAANRKGGRKTKTNADVL